jgi:hypothetical protein
MEPTIAQAVAAARIADRHREAAARRRSRAAAPRPAIALALRTTWSTGRRLAAGWIADHRPLRSTTPEPACCAA